MQLPDDDLSNTRIRGFMIINRTQRLSVLFHKTYMNTDPFGVTSYFIIEKIMINPISYYIQSNNLRLMMN